MDIALDCVEPEVPASAIGPGVVIHPGSRVLGSDTWIGPKCEIGRQGPVTLINCQLGAGVSIASGFCEGSVFYDRAVVGAGAHIRPGCLLEEEATVAHTVGLKQTILLPFVTAGSLVNFCDCFMAGGTSRKHHSEIGSSFIHFNYTPHADKATPSLFGDVPRGVRLDQPPVFLGGQGGVVGPVRLNFGTVLGAGSICREDVREPGQLLIPAVRPDGVRRDYAPTAYRDVRRRMEANFEYLGNIVALREWTDHVRAGFLPAPLLAGGLRVLDKVIAERRKWILRMEDKLTASLEWLRANGGDANVILEHEVYLDAWAKRKPNFGEESLPARPSLDIVGEDYITAVQSLPSASKDVATDWLERVVASVAGSAIS